MNSSTHAQMICAVERAESPDQLVAAVQELAAARLEVGIPTLIAVLGYNNPAAAVVAVAGLIDMGEKAVQPLIEQLDEYNYGARAYAIRALAAIADPRALDLLLTSAAHDFAPSVRRAAAKGLGNLDWNQLDIQRRQSAQAQALQTLLSICQDPDWSIRYAAIVGLQALSTIPDLTQPIQAQFEQLGQTELDSAVCARVQLATLIHSHKK